MRLKDADALLEYFMINLGWHDADGIEVDDSDKKRAIIKDWIDGVPTVDAVPVVHGRWIEYPECLGYTGAYSEHHIVCSECHDVWNIMDNDVDKFDFCPNCGAKMDGERKDT